MSVLWIVLALVALQRAGELVYAARNTARLRKRGATEWGASHYPLVVALHAGWLIAMALFIAPSTPPVWPLLGVYLALQGLRAWTIATLGASWTTRIMTVPDAALVRKGPYRFLRHPNYAIVCAEIAVLPLAFHAVGIAVLFSILNTMLLSRRIRVENRALSTLAPSATQEVF